MMVKTAGKLVPAGFAVILLLLVNTVRSDLLVDRSYLPRFLLLSLLLAGALVALRRKELLQQNLFVVALVLFYLWNLLSSSWSVAPSEALAASQLVFLCLLLFLVVSAFCREYGGFEDIFIKVQLAALAVSFGLAVYKISTLDWYDPYRVISLSANNNLYAGYLVLSLPFVFAGYAKFTGAWKWLSLLMADAAVFMIIILQSRAAYLGLFAGISLSAVLLFVRYRGVFSKKNLTAGAFALVLLSSGVFVFYHSLDRIRQNYFLSKIPVWNYFRSYHTPTVDDMLKDRNAGKAAHSQIAGFDFSEAYYENANLRAIFWKKSFCLIRQHPLTGVGAGNWRLTIPSCREPANAVHTIKNYTYSQPHNEWIGMMAELGLLGFLLVVGVFFLPPGFVLYRVIRYRPANGVPAVFYSAFIIGFYLFASFDFPLRRIEHNVLLFSAFAFLFHHVPLKQLKLPSLNWGLAGGGVLWGLVTGGVIFTIFIATLRIQGEYNTVKMFRYEGKDDEMVIRYARKAENCFYRVTPNTLPLSWFEGVAQFRMGETDSARVCFLRALTSTPWEVRVLNDYAASLYASGKTQEAKSVLVNTLDVDPFFDDARFNLGAILFFTGQRDSALACIRQCRDSQKKKDFLEEMEK